MTASIPLRKIKTVVCGISGGVDSAVSALLLKKKGYEVVGLYMKNWDTANEHGVCLADQDREDAQHVCNHLRIPLLEVNFVKEYWNKVFSTFLEDLHKGITPNPDVLCNKHIKFDAFYNHAMNDLGADAIATGHYVRSSAGYDLETVDEEKGVDLLEAVDQSKCQTLFLSQIPQHALRKTLFPVGDLYKSDVKKIAREHGLERAANKEESMGICFIGKRNFHGFIEEYMEPKPGRFIHMETGKVLGEHKGVHYWTLGQRTALPGLSAAYYVAEKNLDTNDILVVPGAFHPALFYNSLYTEVPHWINRQPRELETDQQFNSEFKYQNLIKFEKKVFSKTSLSDNNTLYVTLNEARRCVCPGQYAVFHKNGVCLGSAKIRQKGPSMFTQGQVEPFQEYAEWVRQSSLNY